MKFWSPGPKKLNSFSKRYKNHSFEFLDDLPRLEPFLATGDSHNSTSCKGTHKKREKKWKGTRVRNIKLKINGIYVKNCYV